MICPHADRSMFWLTVHEIESIHDDLVRDQGEQTWGLLSRSALDMSVHAPNRWVFGEEPYPNIVSKVAKPMHELTTLHPFVDGNKRTAFQSGVVTLMLNGYDIECPDDETIDLMVGVAAGINDYNDLLMFLQKYSRHL